MKNTRLSPYIIFSVLMIAILLAGSAEAGSAIKTYGTIQQAQALSYNSQFLAGLSSTSNELHIVSKMISGDTTIGKTFTITITAQDGDDLVQRISVGRSPYALSDFTIKDCNPAANTCTLSFQMSESAKGTYTYMIKAKNSQNQIINDAVTVIVTESSTATKFNLRTSAVDGEDYDRGIINYVNSVIYVWSSGNLGLSLIGKPFATFSVPSNKLIAARYESSGYTTDIDHFYFDSRLPSCSGKSCTLISLANGTRYTTSCALAITDYHYSCKLSTDEGYSINFDYRATSDPLGPNTIRRYNPIYAPSAPIVNFGTIDVNFVEGQSTTIDLDDHVYDEDTAKADLEWHVLGNRSLSVTINPSTHVATISQKDLSWIGNEILQFMASDLEGNIGSDLLTVRVIGNDNDAPIITSKTPDSTDANVVISDSRFFSITAFDPDHDPLTITWTKDSVTVASNTFNYVYTDTDGMSHVLAVTVSDGSEQASTQWTTHIIDSIGTVTGIVTDSALSQPVSGVTVDAMVGATVVDSTTTDASGRYSIDIEQGTYTLRFLKSGFDIVSIPGVIVTAGETIIQDAVLQLSTLPSGTVAGTVTDSAASQPVSGVTVDAMVGATVIDSTTTNGLGMYSMDLDVGIYTLRFFKSGFDILSIPNVIVNSGATTTQNAVLQLSATPAGTVEGTVTDSELSQPVQDVVVDAMVGATVMNSTTTDASGMYSMDIDVGIYTIRFSKSGFDVLSITNVIVNSGATTTQNAVLVSLIGTIEGTITENDLDALDGVLVELFSGTTLVNSTTTGMSGDYTMDVLSGTYDIRISKSGHKNVTMTAVSIPGGATTTQDMSIYTWWDLTFGNKRKITFSNPASIDLTGQAVPLILDGSIVPSTNDLDDIRFLDETESTELSYTFKSKNLTGDSALSINLGTPTNPTDDVVVWMYYGSASALDNADFTSTFGTDVYTFLPFNDNSMIDISGNGHDAYDYVGTTSYFIDSILPVATGGRTRNDAGKIRIDAGNGLTVITYMVWFRVNNTYSPTMTDDPLGGANLITYCEGPIAGCSGGSDKSLFLYSSGTDKGKLNWFTFLGTTRHLLSTTSTWNADQWYCVAASVDGTGKKLWVDGNLEASDSNGGSWASGSYFLVQEAQNQSGIDIGELRIYSGAKDDNTVKNFCNPPTPNIGPEI